MTFKGIIFDLDGTLADTLSDIAGSMNRVLKHHKYPIHPVENYKILVGRGLDNLVTQAMPPSARQPLILAECLAEMIEDYSSNCVVNTCLYNGIKEMLQELTDRNMKLAIISNKTEPLTHKIVAYLLGDFNFVKIIGARPGFPKKPDPAGAWFISDQMDIPSGNLIYMGDSDVDMITATRAGMYPAGVLWGFRTREELLMNGAQVLFEHPMDVIKLL